MPLQTPFHPRTSAICESQEWIDWSGYLAARTYEPSHDAEYFAIRNSVGLLDVTPLFKYEIEGPDAERLLDRVITRNVERCAVGQVYYTTWCDEAGKVIDDGTVARLGADRFRVTAAEPNSRWFSDCGHGMEFQISDVTDELAALALQGPRARAVLKRIFTGGDLDKLGFFRLVEGEVDGFPVTVTRTGYTGDLGYELWTANQHAVRLWDTLIEAGQDHGLMPIGLAALDMARIEAGLLLIDVDYTPSTQAVIPGQLSSPFEMGLGWTVSFKKGPYIGRRALEEEKRRVSRWSFVGVEIDWVSLEGLFAEAGLPPQVIGRASRSPVPLYRDGRQIGRITSLVFSPILKRYIGLATVESSSSIPGTPLEVEITVEYRRRLANAKVSRIPFYDPEHKRSVL